MKTVLLILIFFFAEINVYCQLWPKIYYINSPNYPLSVIQTYDHGYLVGGMLVDYNGTIRGGFLYKLTINGELFWHKTFYENDAVISVYDVNQTTDGGYIVAGCNHKYDVSGDPFIIKLNACGEQEWCRIYTIGNNRFDAALSIEQIPGGYIGYIYYGYDLSSNNKVHLYRLDHNGDLVWQQLYGQTDTLMMNGAEGYRMKVTPDFHYMLDGFCYYPDSGTTSPGYIRPLIIKVDSSGAVDWELPWSYVGGEHFYGMSFRSIVDNHNTIYSCGRHIEEEGNPPGDRPTMMKTDSSGNELSYHDMVPDSWQAVFFTINWFQDSTIALGGGWSYSYNNHHQGVFKVDKFGNILDSTELYSTVNSFCDAVTSFDDKLFLVSAQQVNNNWRTYAWKLNSDLEYDTLYAYPYVYDSLCPHPIASDTIPLDCVIVGLDEPFQNPETGRLRVYPNPAKDNIHIEIPDQIKTQTHSSVFNLTTVYHQWRSATVEIFDLFGRRMFSTEVRQGNQELEANVSSWPWGMYVVRLVYNGQTVASEKIVVE